MVVFKAHVQNLVVVFLIDSQYAVGMVVFKAHVQNLIVMFLIDSTLNVFCCVVDRKLVCLYLMHMCRIWLFIQQLIWIFECMAGFVVYFNSFFDKKCMYSSNVCILSLECMGVIYVFFL
jgi:hypothetical protein